eukprot:4592033-Prymnesium_polylepis.1
MGASPRKSSWTTSEPLRTASAERRKERANDVASSTSSGAVYAWLGANTNRGTPNEAAACVSRLRTGPG